MRLHDWGCETWRVAAALALACGLDWGRWAAGRDGWCGRRTCPSDFDGQCQCASPPVADPSDAGAYLADCARRGVEPGPLPSLSWTSEDGRAGWEVTEVVVRVSGGWAGFWRHLDGPEWFFDFGATDGGRGSSAADLALLSTLVTAAEAALETTDG
ncbi:MAG: hypothetical protein IPK74_39555 [Deltaproteobacteria bacterium]|nr:hypothetical protein [Deltaproteobacteria bacterium]